MSDSHEEQVFEENLSRLLSAGEPPRLPREAEAEILQQLQAKQVDLYPRSVPATKERAMKRHLSPSLSSKWGYVAAAVLLVAFVVFWAVRGKPQAPPDPAGPTFINPVAQTFEVGEVTRKKLDDGTIVVAHAGSKFTAEKPRQLRLERGEIYLIVAKGKTPFIVKTKDGQAKATGTRFYVSAREQTTAAVAQGKVVLSSEQGSVELQPGQQAVLDGQRAPVRKPAPRMSYLVSWAKEALTQDELLVTKDPGEAGLIALDPWGQEVRLTLRNYHVDVHIEDGIARTTIDQTFFNHNPWNTEGTFYFPLPPDASVSRLAMYVSTDGKIGHLNEGGMVTRIRGQQIYDEILYQRRDPALLEMMEGNVFKMRIFPLEGRQEKRIFLSYTQKLSELYGTLRYWFPMDHTHNVAKQLSIRVRVKDAAGQYEARSSTHELAIDRDEGDLLIEYGTDNAKPDQDFLLHLSPTGDVKRTRAATITKDGFKYVFCRLTPSLSGDLAAKPRQWIILNDVSASRSYIELKAQRYVMQRLMEEADDEDTVTLVNVNTQASAASDTLVNVRSTAAAAFAEKRHDDDRLGGTNLALAFQTAQRIIQQSGADNPHILYLGDGVATDGETKVDALVDDIPAGATFVGIGVGKKVDSRLLQAAADATGGMFTTINPDEDIDWRVFDLVSALNTPRMVDVDVELRDRIGRPVKAIAYPSARALAAGETLFLVARTKDAMPTSVVLRGKVRGEAVERTYSLAGAKRDAGYIPRFWAKRHIDELLKSGEEHKDEIIALSKRYYVVTPYTSLIVLEDEKMYKEFKVERGRKDHWAAYPAAKQIPVVREPLDRRHWQWWWGEPGEDAKIKAKKRPKTVKEIVDSVQFRINAPFYYWRPQPDNSAGRFALYGLADNQADPTGPLTYLYLLAAGIRPETVAGSAASAGQGPSEQREPDVAGRGRVAKTPKTPPPVALRLLEDQIMGPALLRGFEGRLMAADFRRHFAPMYERLANREASYQVGQVFARAASGPTPAMMGIIPAVRGEADRQALLSLMGPSLVEDGKYRPASMHALADSFLAGGGRSSETLLMPKLHTSFQQALGHRMARIDRDIRQFNRQYGYWDEWGNWGDRGGLDLGQSASARWYGGLEELVSSTEALSQQKAQLPGFMMSPPLGAVALDPIPRVMKAAEAPPLGMVMGNKEIRWPLRFDEKEGQAGGEGYVRAMAWVGFYGRTMKSLPGTTAVLAADHLIARRDELKRGEPSEEDKRELAALDAALANLDAAGTRLEDGAAFWSHQAWSYRPLPPTFQPPTVQAYYGYNWSFDLTRYVPGLYSTTSDILNEIVAQYGLPQSEGKISPEAKRRIATARAAIQPVRLRYGKDGTGVLAAGGDRFAITRRTNMYLEERMICDGRNILHLYDELGLAARREASELRLSSLRQLAPHFLEPADWLARQFNVELGDAGDNGFTLHLTPITSEEKQPKYRLTIDVRGDGLITAKTLLVDGKLRVKLAYAYHGEDATARWSDKDDKELAKLQFTATPLDAEAKPFDADITKFVVFDMPIRKPSHYAERLKELGDRELGEKDLETKIRLKRHQALASLQELHWRRWGGHNGEAHKAMVEAWALMRKAGNKATRGDLTLLGCAGTTDDEFAKEANQKAHPVVRYFHQRRHGWSGAAELSEDRPGTLTGHLAAYHAAVRHHNHTKHYDHFVKSYAESPLLLAATFYCSNWGNKPQPWFHLYENPQWRGLALMMSAQWIKTDEHREKLAAAFEKWHAELTKAGYDVPVTPQLATHLRSVKPGKVWRTIVQEKFAAAKKAKRVGPLLAFAESATSWGEKKLSDEALALARDRLKKHESLRARLALAQSYWACNRQKDALKLYDEILASLKAKQIPASPALLAATARLASQAGEPARAIELEERALVIEHKHLPELVNLRAFRRRYQWLWSQYHSKLTAAAKQKDQQAVTDWLARAEQAWRRWREIDRDNPHMVQQMATLQRIAGHKDRAWLYLSTVIDQRPRDAASYSTVSQWHLSRNELKPAEEFLARAAPLDAANPRWLFERAGVLNRMGRKAEARELYQKVAGGKWPPGRQGYVQQAKKVLSAIADK